MSNLNNSPSNPSCSASATSGSSARERHFPRWKRASIALALALGLALMACSMAHPISRAVGPDDVGLTDILYMTGFVLVVLDLLYLPWVLVHMPAALSARVVYEQSRGVESSSAADNL